tara:strand:- start:45 stop:677 length:633 start_codon:yes stop_codon:yes gene_type:complete
MSKKTLMQIFLVIFLFFLILFTFVFFYEPNEINKPFKTLKNSEVNNIVSSSEEQSMIENLEYTSSNNNGDVFELYADYGEPSIEDPDLMFLKNVRAKIIFVDKNNINLISDFANFNTKTFETFFINNVQITRMDEIVTGNELYLVLENKIDLQKDKKKEQNLIRMSHNIFFQKPGYNLKADILEIDLITKNLKIFMNDKIEKVTANSKIK